MTIPSIKKASKTYSVKEWVLILIGATMISLSFILLFTDANIKQQLTKHLIKYEYVRGGELELEFDCTSEWQELNDSYRECVEKNDPNRPRWPFLDYPNEVGEYCQSKHNKYDYINDKQKGMGYVVNVVKKFLFIPIKSVPHHYKITSPPLYSSEYLIPKSQDRNPYLKYINEVDQYGQKCSLRTN